MGSPSGLSFLIGGKNGKKIKIQRISECCQKRKGYFKAPQRRTTHESTLKRLKELKQAEKAEKQGGGSND